MRSVPLAASPARFLVLVLLLAALPAAAARAASERVSSDYFGVNLQQAVVLDPETRARQLDAIASAGIRELRANVSWAALEPEPVTGPGGYKFARYDSLFADAARRGIRVQPTIAQTPAWAWTAGGLGG
ncbi:MAG: hypothetical protein ACRDKX_07585, partial [Solirubrobacterales bacterium]